MPIEFKCHECGKKLRVSDAHAGKRAKCPGCQTILTVPQPAAPPPEDEFELEDPAPTFGSSPPARPASSPAGEAATTGNPFAGPAVNTGSAASSEGMSDKTQAAVYLLAAFLGSFGADRFYLGQTGLAIVKLLTFGGCGVWAIIDLIMTGMGARTDNEGRPLKRDIEGTPQKSQATAFILSWLLGTFGVDRFYLGYTGLGVIKLLTGGGCGIWAMVDMIIIGCGAMKDSEGNSLQF